MSPIIISLLIVTYFIVLLVVAFFTSRTANNDSFFLGNRRSPWYIVAFGMIGASLSGVTFISVPGWVGTQNMAYMQIVLGYFLGYFFIANVLMPVYYKLKLTSIYSYLDSRFGIFSYKTGAVYFLISRIIGASFRLYLVANVLQLTIFDALNVPFILTVVVTILLIWLYTFRGGIKTIIWTDTLQTLFMLLAVILTILFISREMGLNFSSLIETIKGSEYSKIFYFGSWSNKYHFVKQFISGAFITIVMTGLDQDMMQKNLSCKNIHDAKKNMYWFSITLIPVNLLFLSLGVLLYLYAQRNGITIPERTDDLYPLVATGGYLSPTIGILFILGLIAAAYSSADSALTALTTSFTVDILNSRNESEDAVRKTRMWVHVFISLLLLAVILCFRLINNQAVISALFTAAGYTYGPLLGLFCFGLFTKWILKDKFVPIVCLVSPFMTFFIKKLSLVLFQYEFGFELLVVNGLLTFLGLLLLIKKEPEH
ncbi:MAG: sodium:solute symporter [Bacteroidales bacterium]|nr:sodium:solute symporter [Bacteroidales bacterium]